DRRGRLTMIPAALPRPDFNIHRDIPAAIPAQARARPNREKRCGACPAGPAAMLRSMKAPFFQACA
ncbi:hypothetical protein, partial [Rhabdonatronobacter sediminivivens]|uniref:hypothetical protein n=1 Tax=Rhabdonatronobacter sediminivivens TaxID=2743469 RepID=UPI001F47FD89